MPENRNKNLIAKRKRLAGVDLSKSSGICGPSQQRCIEELCGCYDPIGERCGIQSIGMAASIWIEAIGLPEIDDESIQADKE